MVDLSNHDWGIESATPSEDCDIKADPNQRFALRSELVPAGVQVASLVVRAFSVVDALCRKQEMG